MPRPPTISSGTSRSERLQNARDAFPEEANPTIEKYRQLFWGVYISVLKDLPEGLPKEAALLQIFTAYQTIRLQLFQLGAGLLPTKEDTDNTKDHA